MNALKVTLLPTQQLRLPLAHQHMIQGALYAVWRNVYPELHDDGYQVGSRSFRMFTFSPLQGRYKIDGKDILFDGLVRLEVRSPVSELIETLANGLMDHRRVLFGQRELRVVNLETADRLLFFPAARIHMVAPVTIHQTLDSGKTLYYEPTDEQFSMLLTQNLASKLRAADMMETVPALGITPEVSTLRRRTTLFKGIYIAGYLGTFRLETDPASMALLYYAGLGDRSSNGFGMFNIEDPPPN